VPIQEQLFSSADLHQCLEQNGGHKGRQLLAREVLQRHSEIQPLHPTHSVPPAAIMGSIASSQAVIITAPTAATREHRHTLVIWNNPPRRDRF
jgi:hypothetical protein